MGNQGTPGFDWWRLLPRFWIQNDPTDRQWDAALNAALDQFAISEVDRHTCKVGPFRVRIANYPYGYAHWDGTSNKLPMVRTRRRLRAMLAPIVAQQTVGHRARAALALARGESPSGTGAAGGEA